MGRERELSLEHALKRKGNASGCTETEVSALERQCGVELPRDYREFLRLAGHGAPGLWVGSHYAYKDLLWMQDEGKQLMRSSGLELPRGSFVFHMHQGYQFLFLDARGVFYYFEGQDHTERLFDSFVDFFFDNVDM